jgi:hypothetical protein
VDVRLHPVASEGVNFAGDDGIVTFVIRIRREGVEEGQHDSGWVAHVTNVLEQSSRYVRDLAELTSFIEGYLLRMGLASESSSAFEKRRANPLGGKDGQE